MDLRAAFAANESTTRELFHRSSIVTVFRTATADFSKRLGFFAYVFAQYSSKPSGA